MKKELLTIIFFLISTISFSCTCLWGGNFIKANKDFESLIIKAKVIGIYHLYENQEIVEVSSDVDLSKFYDKSYRPFIRFEVKENIKGKYSEKFIELFKPSGFDCTEHLDNFKKDKWYILSIFTRNNQFKIHSCSENYLEYYPETNKVRGRIKGNFRKRDRFYDYEKLVRKIT